MTQEHLWFNGRDLALAEMTRKPQSIVQETRGGSPSPPFVPYQRSVLERCRGCGAMIVERPCRACELQEKIEKGVVSRSFKDVSESPPVRLPEEEARASAIRRRQGNERTSCRS